MPSIKKAVLPNSELSGKPLEHWGDFEKTQDPPSNSVPQLESKYGDEFWKEKLTTKEYDVLRKKGTEAPKTSVYDKHLPKKGHYACRACGNPLYSFKHKFESGCGWPAFGKFVENSIETRDDYSFEMKRTEIVCNRCKGHLGHVFAEHNISEEDSYTERHCVNGISLRYVDIPLPESLNAEAETFNEHQSKEAASSVTTTLENWLVKV